MERLNITVIGYGRVGFHLTKKLHQVGHKIVQVYSRNKQRFEGQFAPSKTANTIGITQFDALDTQQTQVYILAVRDDAIKEVAQKLSTLSLLSNAIVCHTSGATPSTVLAQHASFGVFYPLQTFSRNKSVDFNNVPFCIDGNSDMVKQTLTQLAQQLSEKVYAIDDKQRQYLHIAAVFANNFTNHLCTLSEQICEQHQVPFDILRPLILETALKIQHQSPSISQTGPAIRGDKQTIDKHLNLLEGNQQYFLAAFYKMMSKAIEQTRG
ncbi:MAG: Rossmann-like and DUF2520 domain-containing protein [Chitinophagales bacterium]